MSLDINGKLYCYVHPDRETLLRCNQCERPICTSCAVLTPTGYRCKECVRGQQKKFDTTKWWDYPVAAGIAAILAAIGSYFVGLLGFFTILLAPAVGIGIAEVVRLAVRRRRSIHLPLVTAIAVLVGGLIRTIILLLTIVIYSAVSGGQSGEAILSFLISIIWPAVYAVLAAGSAFTRLKGIKI